MDVNKIGRYIAENRKKNKLTQEQLAEKLGVTSKTVSRWENGNYMPDIAMLKPLSEELGVSLNDLLSGEKVEQEQYQDKLEENILNTIDYTNKKSNSRNSIFSAVIFALGILCFITAMTIFPSESSWGSIYSIFGIMVSLIGVVGFTRKMKYWKRLLICAVFLISFFAAFIGIDYIGVVNIHQAPRFATTVTWSFNGDDKTIYYDTPFYDVIRTNADTPEEHFEVVRNQKH